MKKHFLNTGKNHQVFSLEKHNIEVLKSYNSYVASVDFDDHIIDFGNDWDYSVTTKRAITRFFNETLGDRISPTYIREALKSGKYTDSYGEEWEVHNMGRDHFVFLAHGE